MQHWDLLTMTLSIHFLGILQSEHGPGFRRRPARSSCPARPTPAPPAHGGATQSVRGRRRRVRGTGSSRGRGILSGRSLSSLCCGSGGRGWRLQTKAPASILLESYIVRFEVLHLWDLPWIYLIFDLPPPPHPELPFSCGLTLPRKRRKREE